MNRRDEHTKEREEAKQRNEHTDLSRPRVSVARLAASARVSLSRGRRPSAKVTPLTAHLMRWPTRKCAATAAAAAPFDTARWWRSTSIGTRPWTLFKNVTMSPAPTTPVMKPCAICPRSRPSYVASAGSLHLTSDFFALSMSFFFPSSHERTRTWIFAPTAQRPVAFIGLTGCPRAVTFGMSIICMGVTKPFILSPRVTTAPTLPSTDATTPVTTSPGVAYT